MTREQFLEETALFYNSKNRASGANNSCRYTMTRKGIEYNCAIGRVMDEESRKWVKGRYLNASPIEDVQHLLPVQIQTMGLKFLQEIQFLHDSGQAWGSKGISIKGISEIKEIILNYDLDKTKFSPEFLLKLESDGQE